MYSMDDSANTFEAWQHHRILKKYESGLNAKDRTLAAYGDPTKEGKSRLRYLIVLLPASIRETFHVHNRPSSFTRGAVKSSLGVGGGGLPPSAS